MAASGSPRRLPQPSQQQRNGHDHDRHHHHLSGAEKTAVVDSLLAFDDEADSFLSKARRALESHGLRRPEITVAYKVGITERPRDARSPRVRWRDGGPGGTVPCAADAGLRFIA
eukprot:91784-Chlamydomonas_euryale.AAC.3